MIPPNVNPFLSSGTKLYCPRDGLLSVYWSLQVWLWTRR